MLAQIATDATNAITAVPELQKMLSPEETIVTVDARNCQRAIAQQIIDQGGDYALALMGNQGTLHADVSTFLDDPELAVSLVNENGYWMDAETASRSIAKMPFIDQKAPGDFRRASCLTISGSPSRSSRHGIEIAVRAQTRPACKL